MLTDEVGRHGQPKEWEGPKVLMAPEGRSRAKGCCSQIVFVRLIPLPTGRHRAWRLEVPGASGGQRAPVPAAAVWGDRHTGWAWSAACQSLSYTSSSFLGVRGVPPPEKLLLPRGPGWRQVQELTKKLRPGEVS